MRRTDIVLQAYSGQDGACDVRSEVLGVIIGKESIHLLFAHAFSRSSSLGIIDGPVAHFEIVGEVAHELNGGGNGTQAVVQGGSGNGESTALTATSGKDVVLFHFLT